MRLKNKVAIVTGAGRIGNIGVAICDAFLREGARVVGTDFREEAAAEINERFETEYGPGKFRYLRHDVTSESDWVHVLDATLVEFGQLDVLVNNAGIAIHGGVLTTSLEDLHKVMAVNNDALVLGMKICVPHLEKAIERFPGGGSIINTLSMASYIADANNLAYHVSKAAGRMLTLCAAIEFAPRKIRVNSIHPGMTMTPIVEGIAEDYVKAGVMKTRDEAMAAMASIALLGKPARPEDAAHAFVYLASEESGIVTGSSMLHDGGSYLRY